jgi:hypothetical protein
MIITVKMLESKKACTSQVNLFVELFGDSVEVTKELCLKHASDFDFEWATQHLLKISARRAYNEAVAPARRAYNEAVAPARRAYDEAVALTFFEMSQK